MNSMKTQIEKLLASKENDVVIVNGKWKCMFSSQLFCGWKKNVNSPSLENEARVKVAYDAKEHDGCIVVHKDDNLHDKLYAFFYVKDADDEKWSNMANVTSLSFENMQ